MVFELIFFAVVTLLFLAVMDLIVGVSNDAVNFLNSSLGSKVAPRYIIMGVASLGIMAGVTFSSGMMEVARKGIFNPGMFTMPELLSLFMAVMLSDIIILDLFNTYGLPTSTTVSIVFELLGAAIVLSMVKVIGVSDNILEIGQYINSAKAIIIVLGILLSVVLAFICGSLVQFVSRLIFTFNYQRRLRRYGAVWGGIALTVMTNFMVLKGAAGSSFLTVEAVAWITSRAWPILLVIFLCYFFVLQVLLIVKINIFKPIVLVGTFALAMSFAANDLVNFIGVPLAGLQAYNLAMASADPYHIGMSGLHQKFQSELSLLLIAGMIMVLTLWFSRKSRTVSETELSLGQQEEGPERFGSIFLARVVVRMWLNIYTGLVKIIPFSVRRAIAARINPASYGARTEPEIKPSFDLLRASVNLMVSSALISFATSQKLPLSTTYVTFMVAMGSSFADQAWGRESAVYRITGVLTVIGGWFLTAMIALIFSGTFALIIHYTKGWGMLLLVCGTAYFIFFTHKTYEQRLKDIKEDRIFNLRKITNAPSAISTTFEQMAIFLGEIRMSLDRGLEALFRYDVSAMRQERRQTSRVQGWSNIIIANIFKAMRLLHKSETTLSCKYTQTIRRLQKLSDGHRDLILRSYVHLSNHHKGLLPEQIEELTRVKDLLLELLQHVEEALIKKQTVDYQSVYEKDVKLQKLAERLNQRQINRIHDETSKTRLSIMYYAIVGNALMISKQNLKLLELFKESFGTVKQFPLQSDEQSLRIGPDTTLT